MFISPMLLEKFTPPFNHNPFNEGEYISELKVDGFRLVLTKFNNKIRLFTRHETEVTSRFPELLTLDIPNGTILDGEVVVTDQHGRPDFEETMSRFQAGKNGKQEIQYCVFDIIYYKGEKVTNRSLLERKEILSSAFLPTKTVVPVMWVEGNAETFFKLTQEQDLEGIVMKRKNSLYQINKRSHDWLKVINYQFADVSITGMRKDEFGLLLSFEDDGKLRPAGLMEFMSPEGRKRFYKEYRDLVVKEDKKFIYLKPELKINVKYRNLTKENKLRIPSFVEYIS